MFKEFFLVKWYFEFFFWEPISLITLACRPIECKSSISSLWSVISFSLGFLTLTKGAIEGLPFWEYVARQSLSSCSAFKPKNYPFSEAAKCTWILAPNAVQRETFGNVNIPAVLNSVKTTLSFGRITQVALFVERSNFKSSVLIYKIEFSEWLINSFGYELW